MKRNWLKGLKRTNWSGRRGRGSLGTLGFVLALVGGVIIVALSLASMLNFPLSLPIRSPLAGYIGIGVVSFVLGVVAVIGSRRVTELLWAVILMVVGFLSGGIGGLLALIGGLVGLIATYA